MNAYISVKALPLKKRCKVCGTYKELKDFEAHSSCKYKVRSECKICRSLYKHNNYTKNTEKIKEKAKEYARINRDRINKQKASYKKLNYDKVLECMKRTNKKRRKKSAAYYKTRYHTNIQYNLKVKLGRSLKKYFNLYLRSGKELNEKSSTLESLGCSFAFFKSYFESKFKEGMSWQAVLEGKIHIDHILPISSFDLTKKEQQLKACHYTNLQPLWAKDNLIKSNKIL